jgi:hypothetical protein
MGGDEGPIQEEARDEKEDRDADFQASGVRTPEMVPRGETTWK